MGLKIQHLTVAYGGRIVLNKISFHLQKGCILGLIGPNGAGKTTLIRAISGVLSPKNGKILLDGKDLSRLTVSERARLIAVVPQARSLPGAFTGWETVLIGRTPYLNWLGQASQKDKEISRKAMEMTGTLGLMDRRLEEISGGEQQSLLLARALAQSASILLLDEPTTHLDLRHQVDFLNQVHRLVKERGFTAIMVLHDLNQISRFADQVALLVEGEIKAFSSTKEVMKSSLLSNAFGVDLKVVVERGSDYPVIIPPDPMKYYSRDPLKARIKEN
jgi:iron complex transport system ATP-binding protein